ncbi:MAG: hypothetical protein IBX68_03690 [Dehalococcoidia bacterium]|nr:hypothetical protein [Dehalococcoidia bacterium]
MGAAGRSETAPGTDPALVALASRRALLERILLSPAGEGGLRLRRGLVLGVTGVAFLLIYVVHLSFSDPAVDLPRIFLPFMVLIAADLLHLNRDPLQHRGARQNSRAAFFHAQWPRKYIAARYGLPAPVARDRWLSEFRRWKDGDNPNHQYFAASWRAWFECRMTYYLHWFLIRALLLSVLALLALFVLSLTGPGTGFYSLNDPWLAAVRLAFPLVILGLHVLVAAGNRPGPDNPTGVWLRWKTVNDALKDWWDRNAAEPGKAQGA